MFGEDENLGGGCDNDGPVELKIGVGDEMGTCTPRLTGTAMRPAANRARYSGEWTALLTNML